MWQALAHFTALVLLASLPACSSLERHDAPPATRAIEGTWDMDLSPQQDGSYLKPLTITLDAPSDAKAIPTTFSGSVYGGNPYDNGVLDASTSPMIFSFTSDMQGESGGPYFWVGRMNSNGTLSGTVRSLNRSFDMRWSAKKSAEQ